MEFWLEIDGETIDFDVTRDGDEILVTRDGVSHRSVVETTGEGYRVSIDGKTYEFTSDGDEQRGRNGDRLELGRGGVTTEVVYAARKGGRASGGSELLATEGAVYPLMPGTIMEICCQVGDTVVEGDVLLILEAMKMQNEVAAPVAGVIEEVAVKAGANVDRKTLMVQIEPLTPGDS